jgi:hypothetical protein
MPEGTEIPKSRPADPDCEKKKTGTSQRQSSLCEPMERMTVTPLAALGAKHNEMS